MKSKKIVKFNQSIALLIITCILGSLLACNKKEEMKNPPPTVIVSSAYKQSIIESMQIVGQVVAKESVDLVARVTGFLIKKTFNEGSFVTKDQPLFQIEKTEYEANVEAAIAELDTAKANLQNDTLDLDRQKYLSDKNAVSIRIYQQAATKQEISKARVMSAQANLKEAKLQLSYTDIVCPYNGRIGLAKYSVGNVVGNIGNSNDSLARVVMINPIQVEFNITESSVTTILQKKYEGDKKPNPKSNNKPSVHEIIIKLKLSNGTEYAQEGSIDFIDNVVNSMTGTIRMRAIFKNPKAILIPGSYVTVTLQERDKKNALLIPQVAIQEDQAGKFVMLINKKNEATKTSITVDEIYGTDIVVKSGLKVDDRVIKEGLQKVREGLVVNPITENQKPKSTKINKPTTSKEIDNTSTIKKQDSSAVDTSKSDKKIPNEPARKNKLQQKNTNQG